MPPSLWRHWVSVTQLEGSSGSSALPTFLNLSAYSSSSYVGVGSFLPPMSIPVWFHMLNTIFAVLSPPICLFCQYFTWFILYRPDRGHVCLVNRFTTDAILGLMIVMTEVRYALLSRRSMHVVHLCLPRRLASLAFPFSFHQLECFGPNTVLFSWFVPRPRPSDFSAAFRMGAHF